MDSVVKFAKPSTASLPADLRQLNPLVVGDLIRMGVRMDGGYVVPESALRGADALLSFGLGYDWSFEQRAAELNSGMLIHVYDHTIGERKFTADIANSLETAQHGETATDAAVALFQIRAMMENYQRYRRFFRGRIVHFQERVSDRAEKANDATLDVIFTRLEGAQNIALKMDIEGGEYRMIEGLLGYKDRIRLLVIEFHATEFLREVFLQRMGQLGRWYEVIHIHGNNFAGLAEDGLPDLLEITLLQKSLCTPGPRRGHLPLAGLDFPNDPKGEDHELVFV